MDAGGGGALLACASHLAADCAAFMATIDESARRQRPADSGYRPGVALTQPRPPQRGHSLSLRPWCIGTRPCGLALRAFCIQCVEG